MIKVYSLPTCHGCKQVKEYLKDKDIPFEEVDMREKDNTKLQIYSVPTIEHNGKRYYSLAELKKELCKE